MRCWRTTGTSRTSVFESPLVKERLGQTLLFGERLRNGFISADITLLESHMRQATAVPAMEATPACSAPAPDAYFYAGTGAFGAKFFIGKVVSGPIWQAKKWVGQGSSIRKDKKYRLRVDFWGSQITLYENDVQQLIIVDKDAGMGQCGFATWQTLPSPVRERAGTKAKPRAFVIMPFASQLDFVHGVIEQTITRYGIDCKRADQIAISRPVMEDVKSQIAEADLVIVDFTGKNPNVYYEAGLADAWETTGSCWRSPPRTSHSTCSISAAFNTPIRWVPTSFSRLRWKMLSARSSTLLTRMLAAWSPWEFASSHTAR